MLIIKIMTKGFNISPHEYYKDDKYDELYQVKWEDNMIPVHPNYSQKVDVIRTIIEKEYPEVKEYDEDVVHLARLGLKSIRKRDFRKAEIFFKKLILYQPDGYIGYRYLGILEYRKGKIEEAKALMDKAISLTLAFYHEGNFNVEKLDEIEEERRIIENREPAERIFQLMDF